MIIGINGRIGSGKDTVGKIIQSLSVNHHISHDRSAIIVDYNDLKSCKWEIKKFATKLKQVASLLTGIPVEKFEDQEFKKTYLGKEWASYIPADVLKEASENGLSSYAKMMTVREFLQKLGTEAVRLGLHENAWVNGLFADYKYEAIDGTPVGKPSWIITDMRFPNEYDAVKQRGGYTLRLLRGEKKEGEHISESALDNHEFDYTIDNRNTTMPELIAEVQKFMQTFNL